MAWNLYSRDRDTVVRGIRDGDTHEIRLLKKSDGKYKQRARCTLEEDDVGLNALSYLKIQSVDDVRYGENVPETVLQEVKNSGLFSSVQPIAVDISDNLFSNFDTMSTDEKIFLDEQYKEKIELPDMLSGTNRIAGIFVSAGFATAIAHYSLMWATVLGILSGVVGLSGIVAIQNIRTEVTPEYAPELYELFNSVVEDNTHIEQSNMYVIKSFISSPFTLPLKSDIYFPIEAIENMTKSEIEAILEHELGHHKNGMISMFTIAASIASTLLIAPLLVVMTPIEPNVSLFLILVGYTGVIQVLNLTLGRLDEKAADKNVSKEGELVKSLVRLSPSIYHVNTTAQSMVHRIFDVHPPMNQRIEELYNNSVSVKTKKDQTWGIIGWSGAILTVIGSTIIGYGFLTFTSAGVPESFIFYGTILSVIGLLPQYYINKGKKKTLFATVLIALSLSFTIGLGFWMGADSIVGAVAQGRIGRQVLGMCATLVIAALMLLSTSYYDISPKNEDIPDPATDWFKSIEENN